MKSARREKSALRVPQRAAGKVNVSTGRTEKQVAKMLKLHQKPDSISQVGANDMAEEGYGARLQRLRQRSGVSVRSIVDAMGAKSDTTYRNYEIEKRYITSPIPAPVILAMIPLVVGKGEPPITLDELLAVSELSQIQETLAKYGSTRRSPLAPQETCEVLPIEYPFLKVKYRLEIGVFRDRDRMSEGGYGAAPILPLRTYQQDKQWAAIVDDHHGERFNIAKGSTVVCVDFDAVPALSVRRGTVVVVCRSQDRLSECCLATITGHGPKGATFRNTDGDSIVADPIGLALYSYGPVMEQTLTDAFVR